MRDFTVGVTAEPQTIIRNSEVCVFRCGKVGAARKLTLHCKPAPLKGRYVAVVYEHEHNNYLTICELQVWTLKSYIGTVHTSIHT